MKTFKTDKTTLYMPTKQDIDDLFIGDLAIDCFGRFSEVVSIYAKKADDNGKMFVCYYTKFGESGSSISNSMKEGELVQTMNACSCHTSAELRNFEQKMLEIRD